MAGVTDELQTGLSDIRWIDSGLFNDNVLNEKVIQRRMIFSELEWNREEAIRAYFKVLSRRSHGGTEEAHKKPQISQIPSRVSNRVLANASQKPFA
jgi:hypothetical protein